MNSTLKPTTPQLSLSEALEEVSRLRQEQYSRPDGALTLQEWAEAWGAGVKRTSRILRELVASGRMMCFEQPILDVVGRPNRTVMYKVVQHET